LFKYRDQKRVEPVSFYLPHVNEIGPVRIEFDAVEKDGILWEGKRRGPVINFLQQSFPSARCPAYALLSYGGASRCQVSRLRSVELRRGKQVSGKRNIEAET